MEQPDWDNLRNATPEIWPSTGLVNRSLQRGAKLTYGSSRILSTHLKNPLDSNPYKILRGQGKYTCSIADWTVTMIGSIKMSNGKIMQTTHRTAKLEFCTVAIWNNGEII